MEIKKRLLNFLIRLGKKFETELSTKEIIAYNEVSIIFLVGITFLCYSFFCVPPVGDFNVHIITEIIGVCLIWWASILGVKVPIINSLFEFFKSFKRKK